jgi:hypothetical protein
MPRRDTHPSLIDTLRIFGDVIMPAVGRELAIYRLLQKSPYDASAPDEIVQNLATAR